MEYLKKATKYEKNWIKYSIRNSEGTKKKVYRNENQE